MPDTLAHLPAGTTHRLRFGRGEGEMPDLGYCEIFQGRKSHHAPPRP
jgi:hypothetical protein